ncbi:hypothetical protein [Acinetobacter wuhouensis]|uniref:Uncharacterized protein n=1 Tax=Acinetobacter wuhouensis TaxID=1879050 RepID=A0A3G2T0D0_9GAMM|nr:hypothetical protein [Acinetobacter wuhouensis]AYO53397.1 hypothetical protein CDG68_06930 [Acinetobacter wuhouensis]
MNSEKLIPSTLMRREIFFKIVQNILSIDETSMQKIILDYPEELKTIREIFSNASKEYNRWNKKLCFELPNYLLGDYIASDESSLIFSTYYNKLNEKIKNRINLRIKIQDDLYNKIPNSEKKNMGIFLELIKI